MRACIKSDRVPAKKTVAIWQASLPILASTIAVVDQDCSRAHTIEAGLSNIPNAKITRHTALCDMEAASGWTAADIVILSCDALTAALINALRAANTGRPRPIIVFVEKDVGALVEEAVCAGVMAYIVGGLAESRIRPIVDVAIARFNMFHRLRDECDKAKSDLAARKVIERAKGVLMERNKLSEADAYNTLRRSAMEDGKTILEIANAIIAVTRLLKA